MRADTESRKEERIRKASKDLRDIANRCHELGMSGRFLRRLPILAHMGYLPGKRSCSVDQWTEAMRKAVEEEAKTQTHIAAADGKRRRVE